jgi:hypothetical protein
VLAGGAHPYFTTINEFRLTHHAALAELCVQGLKLCQKAGLVKLGHVSIDGSKVAANASKHKAMSYERRQGEDARLRAEIEALLAQADAIDRAEDERHGVGNEVEDLPAELARREQRLAKIQEAKAALEQQAAQARAEALRENAAAQRAKAADPSVDPAEQKRADQRADASEQRAQALDPRDDDADPPAGGGDTPDDLPHHRVPATPEGTPQPTAQQRMRDKLHTESGKAIYARRKTIAEPPFGQIKEARGFRRFSLRGLAKVRSEWAFVCLTHNLLKLFRATWSAKSTGYTTCPATAT